MSFFSQDSLAGIRVAYASIEGCPLHLAKRLMARVRALNEAGVRDLAGARIRFISRIARNELVRRGLKEVGHV